MCTESGAVDWTDMRVDRIEVTDLDKNSCS